MRKQGFNVFLMMVVTVMHVFSCASNKQETVTLVREDAYNSTILTEKVQQFFVANDLSNHVLKDQKYSFVTKNSGKYSLGGYYYRVETYYNDIYVVDGDMIVTVNNENHMQSVDTLLSERFLTSVKTQTQQNETSFQVPAPSNTTLQEVYQQKQVYYQNQLSTELIGVDDASNHMRIILANVSGDILLTEPMEYHVEEMVQTTTQGYHYQNKTIDVLSVTPGNWKCSGNNDFTYHYFTSEACYDVLPNFSVAVDNTVSCSVGQTTEIILNACHSVNNSPLVQTELQTCQCIAGNTHASVLSDGGNLYPIDTLRGNSYFGDFRNFWVYDPPQFVDSFAGTLGTGQTVLEGESHYIHQSQFFSNYDEVQSVVETNTMAADILYAFQKSWDYFLNVHSKAGVSQDRKKMRLSVKKTCNNASFAPYAVTYSGHILYDQETTLRFSSCKYDGSTEQGEYKHYGTLDIVGHEFAHGITHFGPGLIYQGESGGINEATSDIFGTMIEFYANAPEDEPDYTIAEKVKFLRYMYEPSLDQKSVDYWSNDVGYLSVHYSSGIGNHFFYLLAEGSNPENGPASPTYNNEILTGIGNEAAADIWYDALMQCMLPTTDYCHARACTIRHAPEVYKQKVRRAWDAVNVNPKQCIKVFRE